MLISISFRMEMAWFTNPNFDHIIENAWNGANVFECIGNITLAASTCNKENFGNIFKRKRWVRGRIGGLQKSPDYLTSHSLQNL